MKQPQSHLESMYTLLKLCTEDVKTTHVPARASFDDHQMEKYFDFLAGLGLLTVHDGECGTTEKGRRFISGFEGLLRILGEDNAIGGE